MCSSDLAPYALCSCKTKIAASPAPLASAWTATPVPELASALALAPGPLSILITFFIGLIVAWGIVKIKNDTIKIVLDGIFTLPIVLPPTVVGFFLLYIFGVRGPIGMFFIDFFAVKIAFSWPATVIAAVVMSFPLMYRSARGAFEQVDSNLLDAGRTLGMSEWKIFWKILFANAFPGIISGGILSYARGLGEFGATAMLAGNIAGQTRTLPSAEIGRASCRERV